MNSITVFNGEKHERSARWYVAFAVIVWVLVVFSLLYGNYSWVVLLFFLVGWYFFYQVLHLQQLSLIVQDDGIHVGKVFFAWWELTWFTIEVYKDTWLARNLVLLTSSGHHIYSFVDDLDKVKEVVMIIDERLPLLETYSQTFAQRLLRMVKL